ncbi:MFS transporter [Kitasatospora sp. NE20-6]|uniref:MFS transporter n=1 Tax=Kitasatospora sp. NE20-6 TaxID=2859066 RepID=UPI0034DB81F4
MTTTWRQRLTLTCSITGAVTVAVDGTVLTVAQPALRHDLHASLGAVQWTSTGYLITVASLLVLSGRIGDRYGHRRVFALGMLGFAGASAGIGLAPGVGSVIGLRILQGAFGALLQPATLGMLRAAYPADRLAMPIALRTSAIGLAAAAGPLVGGALTTHLGWRSVFFLSAVPALLVGVPALALRDGRAAPALRPGRPAGLDLPGAALLGIALACLVHTLVRLPGTGPTPAVVAGCAVAATAGAAFVRHERRTPRPLLPARLLTSAPVVCALAVLVTASAALFGTLFVSTYYLQDVLGLDPFGSSLRALPLAAAMVLGAPVAATLLRRHGPRRTAGTAAVLLALGVLVLSRLGRAPAEAAIGGGFLLLGAGFVTVMVTGTAVVVRSGPAEDAGVAGGLQQTALNIGPALGVAAAAALPALTTDRTGLPAMAPTLTVLAAVAAAGALAALGLPGRTPPHGAPPPGATAITTGSSTAGPRNAGTAASVGGRHDGS